ncbi:LOW QUALITY PROTEIN: hypothetical protein Dda_0517 [Drechslerella dactyloides]|uniref:FAD/NAD(P)-binding domain-containing protein n=1 Tax=Drechslerella dactyloides TaxID=74499 RepID=A0AAD6NM23_DREDA|nr:LOW QUALITY PROTEIN: hypothetical protein Dda_0517 [Drechslerella dactyloides]
MVACFDASTGDIEDAPGLDSLHRFPVTVTNDGLTIEGDEDKIKAFSRTPAYTCSAATASDDNILIVGGGSGALGVIEGLRQDGYKGKIVVLSKEAYPPIDRTKLSKALITDPGKITLRDLDFLKGLDVEFHTSTVVKSVDFDAHSVVTEDGSTFNYKKIVLATGATPRQLPLKGFKELGNIFVIRTVDTAKAIVDAVGLDGGKKIVVIGSSFIGMEVANFLVGKKHEVTVIQEYSKMERVMGKQVGASFQTILEKKGVKFYMKASVEAAEPNASNTSLVGSVTLKDGTSLEADAVILGVGVAPATEAFKSLPLEKDGSLRVDENFQITATRDAYAVGDIATYPYRGPGGGPDSFTRIEHWNVAQNAGRSAAKHIATGKTPHFFTPIFWSALGVQLRYCGNTVGGYDDVIIQGSLEENRFVAYYTSGEKVVAVATMQKDPVTHLGTRRSLWRSRQPRQLILLVPRGIATSLQILLRPFGSDDLFVPRRAPPGHSDDQSDNDDEDEGIEEIFHLTLRDFYPALNVGLLQRSMGIPIDIPLAPPSTGNDLEPFVFPFSRHNRTSNAGSLRNYVYGKILGTRPTWPYTLITFLRQIEDNPPFVPWPHRLPVPPFPTTPATVIHWDIDKANTLLHPRQPLAPPRQPVGSSQLIVELDLLRVNSAWDLQRDQLVQAISWCNAVGDPNRILELRYGDALGSFEEETNRDAFVCLCGCGMGRREDVHFKISVMGAVYIWFPYQRKPLPPVAKYMKHVRNGIRHSTPLIRIDLYGRTVAELTRRNGNKPVKIEILDQAVIGSRQPQRFASPKDHADWYASFNVLFFCMDNPNQYAEKSGSPDEPSLDVEDPESQEQLKLLVRDTGSEDQLAWVPGDRIPEDKLNPKYYLAVYRINALDLTVKLSGLKLLCVSDRDNLVLKHTHNCEKISKDLLVKHYPLWGQLTNSMVRMPLEELGLELRLDGFDDLSDDEQNS